jgi:hypothetical protein
MSHTLRQVLPKLAKHPYPPAQSAVVMHALPCVPGPGTAQAVCSIPITQHSFGGVHPRSFTGSHAFGSGTHAVPEQLVPNAHVPQEPPQPSLPHVRPAQDGMHTHIPAAVHVLPAAHDPHEPPHPSTPH